MKRVVVDTDYFNFITMNLKESGLFLKVMKELQYEPVMHEFVYTQELHENSFVKKLVDDGSLIRIGFDSLRNTPEKSNEYSRLFSYAYYEMNGKKFDNQAKIESYHHEKENLGEIHSAILAWFMDYDYLMSNDSGAKTFIESKLNTLKHSIHVIDIEETFTSCLNKESSTLKWSDLKNTMGQLKIDNHPKNLERLERIRKCWVDSK